jgi:[ribosomal protein S5]-alanine N-acetyltransferase
MYKILKNERLVLRKITPRDSKDIFDCAKDEEVSLMVPLPTPYTRKNADDYIKLSSELWKNKKEAQFGIELEGRVVGMIGLMGLDFDKKSAEIGYWLGKNYWGKGIMFESLKLVLVYAFSTLKLRRIHAGVYQPNLKSAKLLEKIGFIHEGIQREHGRFLGKWEDLHLFGLLRKDFN